MAHDQKICERDCENTAPNKCTVQQLLEMKDWEMDWVKNIAQNILNDGTEVERFYIDAL